MLSDLKAFDAFSRTDAALRVKTKAGGLLSIFALVVMVILFVQEVSLYMQTRISPRLSVDTSLGGALEINLDITFHSLPCAFISVNAIDKTGGHQLDVHHNVFTTRLNQEGDQITEKEKEHVSEDKEQPNVVLGKKPPCGNCYGAESETKPCCDTCDDVKAAYSAKGWAIDLKSVEQCVESKILADIKAQKGEGCNVHGFVRVNKVAGNLNIVPGKFIVRNTRYMIDTKIFDDIYLNVSHTINKVAFGQNIYSSHYQKEYPGMQNPLRGIKKIWTKEKVSPMYEYLVKIVPTTYRTSSGELIETNQYSATDYVVEIDPQAMQKVGAAGFFLIYDLSPIHASIKEESISFLSFLTNLLAILGGVFTVVSLTDSLIYGGLKKFKKKADLGKIR